ncbi:MAG: hypothetical protein ACREUF_12975, partial [Solimonas sp.]
LTLAAAFATLMLQPMAAAGVGPAIASGPASGTRQGAAADGPWFGVWRMSPERTAEANGRPRPAPPSQPADQTHFRMVSAGKGVFKYTIETVPASGGPARVRAELIGRFDGKDYIEIGNPGADTNRFRIVDERTYEVIDTKDGKDLLTIRITISPDGLRTSEAKGVDTQGRPVHRITVWERVEDKK